MGVRPVQRQLEASDDFIIEAPTAFPSIPQTTSLINPPLCFSWFELGFCRVQLEICGLYFPSVFRLAGQYMHLVVYRLLDFK